MKNELFCKGVMRRKINRLMVVVCSIFYHLVDFYGLIFLLSFNSELSPPRVVVFF